MQRQSPAKSLNDERSFTDDKLPQEKPGSMRVRVVAKLSRVTRYLLE